MPYFPPDDDNKITLTLADGQTVTLVEKNLGVDERKAMTKRTLLLQSEFEFMSRQEKSIEKKMKAADLNKDDFYKAASEQADLRASVSIYEVYATMLPWRFESWDVYQSRADYESGKPAVAMEKDAIVAFAYAKKKNGLMLAEIVDLLAKHDKGEEKKDESALDDGGSGFTTKEPEPASIQ